MCDGDAERGELAREVVAAARVPAGDGHGASWDVEALTAASWLPVPHVGWELVHHDERLELRRGDGMLELCFVGAPGMRLGDVDLALRPTAFPKLEAWAACGSLSASGSVDCLWVATVDEGELMGRQAEVDGRRRRWSRLANESAGYEEC